MHDFRTDGKLSDQEQFLLHLEAACRLQLKAFFHLYKGVAAITYLDRMNSTRLWFHGLVAAAIGGSANAVTLILVDPTKFNFSTGLKPLIAAALASGVVAAAAYLKQSPVPPEK